MMQRCEAAPSKSLSSMLAIVSEALPEASCSTPAFRAAVPQESLELAKCSQSEGLPCPIFFGYFPDPCSQTHSYCHVNPRQRRVSLLELLADGSSLHQAVWWCSWVTAAVLIATSGMSTPSRWHRISHSFPLSAFQVASAIKNVILQDQLHSCWI